MYLIALATDQYKLAYFVLGFMNAFTFIPRKNHENPPNKLMVTKFIRDTLPMFNNKAFFGFIDKILTNR